MTMVTTQRPVDPAVHIVGEAWRAVRPHFTDGKTDAQDHWAVRRGAESPGLQPGSRVYTLTHPALPRGRVRAAEMSGLRG